jgi:hypothetical protein
MPLTTEELIKTIESNQSAVMFHYGGDVNEDIVRNSSGNLARFRQAFNKYPPVYWDKYEYMDLYDLLTKNKITFIVDEVTATMLVKKIEVSKCTHLFMTAIDGIHLCVL